MASIGLRCLSGMRQGLLKQRRDWNDNTVRHARPLLGSLAGPPPPTPPHQVLLLISQLIWHDAGKYIYLSYSPLIPNNVIREIPKQDEVFFSDCVKWAASALFLSLSLWGKSYQCHQRAGTAAAKPPWQPAEWEMRNGRRARCRDTAWYCAGALQGAENTPFCPLAFQTLSGFVWISSLPGTMTATSSYRIMLIHHCCYLWKTGCTSKPCSCMWPNSTSNSQLMAHNLSQRRTHECTLIHLYWHIQAHAEAWINISPSVLNENINWQLFSAASICGVSSQFTVSCKH